MKKAAKKFFNFDINKRVWESFFKTYPKKDDIILDFGCGAGWSIYFGRRFGFEVYGLDINYPKNHPLYEFNEFREKLKIEKYVKLYDGQENIPFRNNRFSIIVCKASLMKYTTSALESLGVEKLTDKRTLEFQRILKNNGYVITTNYGFGCPTSQKLRNSGTKIVMWNHHKDKEGKKE